MDQNLKQSTIDNLTKAQAILIVVSQNAGTGAVAAGLALMLACEKLGKNVSIVAKNPTVSDAQKLYGVDKIGLAQGSQNLVLSVGNAVETVDRVSHYLDGDNLKLTLHAFPGSKGPSQKDITFSQEMVEPDVIFVIGFQSEDEVKQSVSQIQNISPNTWLVNISRQDMGQIFAQMNVFEPNASGLAEVTAQILADLALPLDEDIAFNLYQGIAEDTNQFNPSAVGPKTFDIASWLIKFGAGHASLASTSDSESRRASFAGGTTQAFNPQHSMVQPSMTQTPQPEQPFDLLSQNQPPQNTQSAVNPFQTPQASTLSGQPFGFKPQAQMPANQSQPINTSEINETPLAQVEREKGSIQSAGSTDDDWLSPPKIYKGSKSFDSKE